MTNLIELKPIGFVRAVKGEEACLELLPAYKPGLLGIESHKRIFVLYWMHEQKDRSTLQVHPKRDTSKPKVGVFASRAPVRLNPIGLSLVELVRHEGRKLIVRGLDALEGSPILDINPAAEDEVSRAER
jgi:L-fuculose-phosphate aldolase